MSYQPPVFETQQTYSAPVMQPAQTNVPGIVGFVLAVVGFVFVCIPGAFIIGWVLLPAAFILSIVALCLRGKKKAFGIAGLSVSVVGTIVGFIVFFAFMAFVFGDAAASGKTEATAPQTTNESAEEPAKPQQEAGQPGSSREHPLPMGSTVKQRDWELTINSVNLNADQLIAEENQFNDPAGEGNVYILVNATVKYLGKDAKGEMPMSTIEYVTVDGNTVNNYDVIALAPEPLDTTQTLYNGASVTGNTVFAVPAKSAGDGVLSVRANAFGDSLFVAVK
ncbi:DUF308 domain-containing protein [Leucobacter iarius]|uniref:DUF4352 domain-containing protein n=1 Tax=Leucobacter iarius TaxID=333963 RepID=A0ABP4XS10_9MICO